jgi:hypothetical protein
MIFGTMRPEIDAWRECDPRIGQRLAAEALAVETERRAIGVDEKPAGRQQRNREAQLAQGRHQEVAPRLEFAAASLENRQRRRLEARERGALR